MAKVQILVCSVQKTAPPPPPPPALGMQHTSTSPDYH
jgi:hypothetical protein